MGILKNQLDTFYGIIRLSVEKDIYGLRLLLKTWEQKNVKKYGTEDIIKLRKQKALDYFSF